jgi:preprotein translocase subunit YajC
MKTSIPYSASVAGMNQKLKKGDKVLTASGDTQTVFRVNSNDNVETEESQYTWSKCNLKKLKI